MDSFCRCSLLLSAFALSISSAWAADEPASAPADEPVPVPAEDAPGAPLAEPAAQPAEPPPVAAPVPPPRRSIDDPPGAEMLREPTPAPQDPYRFMSLDIFYAWLGIHSGAAWVDSAEAARARMGTVGPTIYISFGIGLFDLVTAGASLGAVFPSDKASFREDVVPLFGEGTPMSAESTLQVTNYSWELGLRTPSFCIAEAPKNNCFALHGFMSYGRSAITAERFIEDCGDCGSRDLELKGGSFLEPGVAIGLPSRDKFGIDLRSSFRRYLGDAGLASDLRIGFALLFL